MTVELQMLEPKDFHIFLVPHLDDCPESFRTSLMEKGFSTELCSSVSEVTRKATTHQNPLLVANCGSDEDIAIEFAKGLVAEKQLFSIPLLLLGADAVSLERAIQRYYPVVVALNTPFLRNEGLSAIQYLVENAPQAEPRISGAIAAEEDSGLSETLQQELPLPDRDIRTLVFTQLSQLPKEDIG